MKLQIMDVFANISLKYGFKSDVVVLAQFAASKNTTLRQGSFKLFLDF